MDVFVFSCTSLLYYDFILGMLLSLYHLLSFVYLLFPLIYSFYFRPFPFLDLFLLLCNELLAILLIIILFSFVHGSCRDGPESGNKNSRRYGANRTGFTASGKADGSALTEKARYATILYVDHL